MHLQLGPETPILIRAAAGAALYSHIGGAVVGLGAGAVAMVAKKGGLIHRRAGDVFTVAMLVMAGVGAIVAPMIHQLSSSFGGAMTCYLVFTGWMAGRRREISGGPVEIAGVALLAVTALVLAVLGRQAMAIPTGGLNGIPWQAFVGVTVIALLIAAIELKVILGPTLSYPQRISRHLWRMGVGLLMAYLSFLGQPVAIPKFMRGSPWLFVPAAALAVALVYWLVRLHGPRRPNSPKPDRGAGRAAPLEALS